MAYLVIISNSEYHSLFLEIKESEQLNLQNQ